MAAFYNLRIGTKIYAVIGLLALVAVAMGWTGIDAMRTYEAKVEQMGQASTRAVLGERANGLVLAVVMDSRGVYMARDANEVEKFGGPLLANLARLDTTLAEWKALMPEARRDSFRAAEEHARQFIRFRTELVRLGREVDAPTARDFGDNDENRAIRAELNREIENLADENNRQIAALGAEMAQYYGSRVETMLVTGSAGIAVVICLALVIVLCGVTRPLNRMAGAMTAVADGRLDIDVPALGRR
ncbi:MAG: methyl-accepting chemotaxis protein, partial [Alphaproteobacteria bacterium]|nr:methyl-accepting chemotaxis protein [Alphaproteobacteria bacterium]